MLAAGPRPARPRRLRGRAPAGPGPIDLLMESRHGLVRADPLARAGRPVLRPAVSPRDPEPGRLAPDRGPLPRPRAAAPAGDLAGGLAGRPARLEASGPAGPRVHRGGQLVPRGVP